MEMEIINPNVSNFIIAIRDIGYTLEVAVADIIDNSITAKSKNINIFCTMNKIKEISLEILDDGIGMNEEELVEAMRLGSKDPTIIRSKTDLGRFGLGLKTASFSQCKKLTVFTKKEGKIFNRQWDLDYIEKRNEWFLKTLSNYENYEIVKKLEKVKSGTVVIWENIDRFNIDNLEDSIFKLNNHLSLVFHRFLEKGKFKIVINENKLEAFNPFNIKNMATYEAEPEEVKFGKDKVIITPYVLPHHSKVTQQEYKRYGTEDGYLKSQGFYLYRADRLLIYGTWFGLHKITDAHKLVRIQIDISNKNDTDWGIDVKKSTAKPAIYIKEALKRTINQITVIGSRPYTGRGRKLEDKTTERYWQLHCDQNKKMSFKLNKDNEIYKILIKSLSQTQKELLEIYLKQIEECLPLDSILAQLQQKPHDLIQKPSYSEDIKKELLEKLKAIGLDEKYLNSLETFKY